MKNKFIPLTLILCVSLLATKAQVTYGVHASFIGSNLSIKADDPDDDGYGNFLKTRPSFRAGVVATVPLSKSFAFMPQLNFVSAGSKISGSSSDAQSGVFSVKGSIKPNFIELPLNFVYKVGMESGNQFFIGAGPSIAAGIGGKAKVTLEAAGFPVDPQEGDIKFDGKKDATDDNMHLKRFNFGGNVVAGYQLSNGLFFQANYNLGFNNLSPDADQKIKSRYFGVGVGFNFGGKK